jgi:RNA polymerase sigma-70 factor (ECF subfamily)
MAGALMVALPEEPDERLAALFDAHYERLYRLARRLAPGADEACDLVQETFLKAAGAPRSVPIGHAGEEAWLVRVLINIRRDQWRRQEVRARHDRDLMAPAHAEAQQESALIAHATVWGALDRLTPRRRAVIVMHELEELPIAAIASTLGITAVTARWHLAMGRRDLARVLRPQMGLRSRSREATKDGERHGER